MGQWEKGFNHAYLTRPYAAISTQVSALPLTAHIAITTISSSRCLWVRSTRGAGRCAQCSRSRPRWDVSIVVLPTQIAVVQDSTVKHLHMSRQN
jgi:hypothetical protein